MKRIFLSLFLAAAVCSARADLTIVQKVERTEGPGETILKMKGDTVRMDVSPTFSMIFDHKTDEMIQLMRPQKTIMRIPGEKMRALAETMKKSGISGGSSKITPTGKKETIEGYEAEEYTSENPTFRTSYWLAPKFPNGAAVLGELRRLKPSAGRQSDFGMPGFSDLPAVPIRTVFTMGETKVTSTIVSVKQEPIDDAVFAMPPDYKELQIPDFGNLMQPGPKRPHVAPSPE